MRTPIFPSTQVASSTPFDNTQNNGYSSSDVQSALQELRDHTVYDSRTQVSTLNGTLTLTSADTNMQFITGTATGYTIVMPSALAVPAASSASYYQLANTSSVVMTVKDGAGNTLFTFGQNSVAYLWLQAAGSAGGTWLWYQTSLNVASGVLNYNVVSSTPFSANGNVDSLITGMSLIPQAGTYAIWANYQLSGINSALQVDTTIYNAASAIADSKRSNLSTAGTHIFSSSTMTISQFNGTASCGLYWNPNGNSFTVVNRSLLLVRLGT